MCYSSKIEVEYQEAVALKRKEELICEEEVEWMTGFEQKTKWGASEKDKKSKKKQNEIMAIVRGGKQQGHIPGVGRVLPGQRTVIPPPSQGTHLADIDRLKKREKLLTKEVNMFNSAPSDGVHLIEADRVLKPRGYFVWTSPIANTQLSSRNKDNLKIWDFFSWDLLSQQDKMVAYIGGIYSRRWIPIKKRPTWPSRATMGFRELAIVTEWKFEKDEIEIAIRDITNNTEGPQLDCSRCTFTRDIRAPKRLDFRSLVNDEEHSVAVESSIISNILSMILMGVMMIQFCLKLWYHRCWKTAIGSALSSLQSLDKFIQLLEKFEEGFKNTGLPDKHDYEKGKFSRDIAENSIFKDEKELTCSNGVAANELLGADPAAISLPLIGSDHGTILHVSIQLLTAKTVQQRDKGLQSGNNIDKETKPNTARSSSFELEMLDDRKTNKVEWVDGDLLVEDQIHNMKEKVYAGPHEPDLSFFEVLFNTVHDLKKEIVEPESMLPSGKLPSPPLEKLLVAMGLLRISETYSIILLVLLPWLLYTIEANGMTMCLILDLQRQFHMISNTYY
uniref:Uncharacterized protein n=1 Tax=Tanacetum cinerariifolium TaxID=118510 RepID=A0A6L2L298_TANCI|nr:hypothetical protein [Tanacetum cinerariifolium]